MISLTFRLSPTHENIQFPAHNHAGHFRPDDGFFGAYKTSSILGSFGYEIRLFHKTYKKFSPNELKR